MLKYVSQLGKSYHLHLLSDEEHPIKASNHTLKSPLAAGRTSGKCIEKLVLCAQVTFVTPISCSWKLTCEKESKIYG